MNFKQKVTAAQIAILKKYGVMVDLANLKDNQLDRALRGSISVKEASSMTFASWCDKMFGLGVRVPVATFDKPTAGQISLSKLVAGKSLAEGLKASDKKNNAALKALQSDLANRTEREVPDPRSHVEIEISYWYERIRLSLNKVLLSITDINGPIFKYQGPKNYDFRDEIAKIIFTSLRDLGWLGLDNEVILRDSSDDPKVAQELSPLSHTVGDVDRGVVLIEFIIRGVQADGIAAGYMPWDFDQHPSDSEPSERFDCHVKIRAKEWDILNRDDLSNLSWFLQKLFDAWAKAGDRRSRGSLREALMLCQMLAYTAPCHSQDVAVEHCISSEEYGTDYISAGKVVERFFHITSSLRKC
ncbi:MAG: hypothetical protein V7772_07875 [Pseudomonas profundi]|uniref:hypothetical protein n=1 Tax=Pseudomonas profundi TaxID=1981513 RepID=UPI0030029BEF